MPRLNPRPAGPPLPMFWRADPGGRWTWADAQWSEITGMSRPASLGDGWLEAVHPQDREAALLPLLAEDGACRVRGVLRLRRCGHHGYCRVLPSAAPVQGPDGALREWIGTLQELPVEDPGGQAVTLQHHMRGALALIRSVARRTAQTSDTVERHAAHFEGRLDAVARVQDAVIRSPEGVDLEGLIREELVAHRFVDAGLVFIDGPRLRLADRAAEIFVLAVHELAVNAVKFGALTTPSGAVSVSWVLDRSASPPTLLFCWSETGVTVAGPAPRRRGFGTDLIERCMPADLGAVTRLDFLPGEVRCSIAMPLPGNTSP